MSLVLRLQKKCLDSKESLQDLLREALLISSKLKLNDFKTWINCELKGYDSIENPDYREVATTLKFFNPYRGWISAIANSKKLSDSISHAPLKQPISELENLLQNDNRTLILNIPHTLKIQLMEIFATDCEPALFVDKSQIHGIMEQVRNLLLEWTLKLEEDNILGNDDLIFSEEEKTAAKSIHIEHFNGVMGDISKIGNFSTGANSTNIYNESNVSNEIDKLIEEVKKLQLVDKKEIIAELEASKNDPEKAKITLGKLLTKGAEVASIGSMIISTLGLL